jgi:hypothetical protein
LLPEYESEIAKLLRQGGDAGVLILPDTGGRQFARSDRHDAILNDVDAQLILLQPRAQFGSNGNRVLYAGIITGGLIVDFENFGSPRRNGLRGAPGAQQRHQKSGEPRLSHAPRLAHAGPPDPGASPLFGALNFSTNRT